MATVWRVLLVWINISQALSLRCAQCVGSRSACGLSAVKCPAYETTCLSLAISAQDGSNTLMKGCSRPDICNQTSVIDTGNHSIYMTSKCCETNYCNLGRFNTDPVFSNRLVCNQCQSNSTSCTPTSNPIFCDEVSNNCVDVITQDFINETVTKSSYTKGCGSATLSNVQCTNLFAYDTGSRQRYTYMSCCNSNNQCNNARQSIPILTNHNGDTCYGCYETGKNECADANLVPVKCKGILIRCMEAFDQNRRTLMKGCSTVAFCSSTYPSLQVPNISEIQCCAGSYCNNFTTLTSTTAAVTTSSAVTINRDFTLLLLFMSLLYATVRHVS